MRQLRKNVAMKASSGLTLNEKLTIAMGVGSLVVALGSLGIAWWSLKISIVTAQEQIRETRENDRKGAQMAASFLTETNDVGEVGIYIENNGLGPARLDWLRIYVDSKPVNSTSEVWRLWGASDKVSRTPPSYHEFNVARSIRPGDKWGLLFLDRKKVRDLDALKTLLRERTFMIGEACDMYSRCAFMCTKGDWRLCQALGSQLQAAEFARRSAAAP